MAWLLDWGDVVNQTRNRIMNFGAKPGPNLDQAAILRNLAEYEDQYAAAMNFTLRFYAYDSTAMFLFMDQLTPEQRTPIREAGLQKARRGGAEMISSSIGSVAVCLKPANARLMTTAIRDTRDVWAKFILPNDRVQIISQLAKVQSAVKDDEVKKNLAAFAAALTAAK